MSAKDLHIIQKEKVDISFPNYKALNEWEIHGRQKLMHAVHHAIERAFEEHDTGGHLIVERLELDLGVFTALALQQEMPGRVYADLKKVLGKYKKQFHNGDTFSNSFHRNSAHQTLLLKQNEQFLTQNRGRLESLVFFLQQGYLPWWASALADWGEPWLHQLTAPEWAKFKTFIASEDATPVLRITTQFSDGFLAELVKGMGVMLPVQDGWHWLLNLSNSATEFKNISDSKHAAQDDGWPSQEFRDTPHKPGKEPAGLTSGRSHGNQVQVQKLRQQYWIQWINYAAGSASIPTLSLLLGEDSHTLNFARRVFGRMRSIPRHSSPDNIPPFWKNELDDDVFDMDKTLYRDIHQNLSDTQSHDMEGAGSASPIVSPFNIARHHDVPSGNDKDGPQEKMFITAAGLALLHPFLPQLFTSCGWVEKQRFHNAYMQTKAVYALYYLATGIAEASEHQLLLPKLLCGMPWEKPLEPVVPLVEAEKLACEELLRAVITHWKALKNTSPDGLREGFLLRRGKLEHDENGWRLEVEPQAQDVLMNRLPWGVSIIKYHWMTGMLSVSWLT